MATKYVCDRCGKEDTDRDEFAKVSIPHSKQSYNPVDEEDTFSRDICRGCLSDLNLWIQPLPKVVNKDDRDPEGSFKTVEERRVLDDDIPF